MIYLSSWGNLQTQNWLKSSPRLAPVRSLGSDADARLLLRILLFALATRPLLFLNPTQLRWVLVRLNRVQNPGMHSDDVVARHVEATLVLGHPLVADGCLSRGIVMHRFLSGNGSEVSLCFGVGRMNGDFAAHCWIVKDGEPYLEKTDPRLSFSAIHTIP